MDDTLLIFTGYTYEQLRIEGESRAWRLSPENARNCTYAVMCFNARGEHFRDGKSSVEHGSGFLVGRIAGIVPSRDDEGRWIVRFSEVAEISLERLWPGHQSPFTYTSIHSLGIDPGSLNFQPVGTLA